MIPGPKVGLIIGKGGETIKQLQEKSVQRWSSYKMGQIQNMRNPTIRRRFEYAKQLVLVPRAAVGVVIGKGGDMIKKIQAETGARVQFQQARDEGPGDRRCFLSGNPKQVEQRDNNDVGVRGGGGGGRGGGRGGRGGGGGDRFDRGNRNGGQDYGGGGNQWDDRRGPQQPPQEVSFTVPSVSWHGTAGLQPPRAAGASPTISSSGVAANRSLPEPQPAQTGPVQVNPSTGQPDYSLQWAEYYRSSSHQP
ncbi:hypothetical protein NQ318_023434, partial [Aromia moschata]